MLKTVLVIAVTTARMLLPGVPDMPKMPGMKNPGVNAPSRTLTFDLTSDKKVDSKSKAEVAIPQGLLLGSKLDLTIDLPSDNTGVGRDVPGMDKADSKKKLVMKLYWESSQTVLPGQPKVFDSSQISGNSAAAAMMDRQHKAMAKMKAIADESHAYWPGEDNRKVKMDAAMPGGYTLTTNYCGGTSIDLGNPQNFLAPIALGFPKGINLEKAIDIKWKSVPEAAGYILTAFASSDDELVMWTSSKNPDKGMDVQGSALTPDELKKLLDNGILLKPGVTSCSIPAGIFKGKKSPMLMVIAVGGDKIQEKDGILTQVVVRSTATCMLTDGTPATEEPTGDDKTVNKSSDDDDLSNAVDEIKDEAKDDAVSKVKNKLRKIFK